METKTKQMSAPPGLLQRGRLFSGAAQLAQFFSLHNGAVDLFEAPRDFFFCLFSPTKT